MLWNYILIKLCVYIERETLVSNRVGTTWAYPEGVGDPEPPPPPPGKSQVAIS